MKYNSFSKFIFYTFITVRMKKNVPSRFGHFERISDERVAKKIYDGKVSGKRGRGDLG